jgi:hypothetical protein
MDTRIKRFTKFRTSDGREHDTKEMARQHLRNQELVELFEADSFSGREWDGQEIVNVITSNRALIRDFLDCCDAMERKVVGS